MYNEVASPEQLLDREASMKTDRSILLYLLSIAAVTFGVLVSFQYNWPDFVHTNYGLPFIWATHTTVTITGPVDKWNVNLANLFLNIVVWLSISFTTYWGHLWITGKSSR